MPILKKWDPRPLLLLVLLFSLVFPFASHAAVLSSTVEGEKDVEVELVDFIPDGYRYYICSSWTGENTFPLIFFKDVPTFDSVPDSDSWGSFYHVYSSDGSDPLFYDFFCEEDLLSYVHTGELPENVRIRENYINYARLDLTPSIYYTNTRLSFSDTGETYAPLKPFTKTVSQTVPYTKTLFAGMDSAALSSPILSEILALLPVLLAIFVGYIGIRKGLGFLVDFVKGV